MGNWQLVIGNWKKVIDNRQLVIGQKGRSRQSGPNFNNFICYMFLGLIIHLKSYLF